MEICKISVWDGGVSGMSGMGLSPADWTGEASLPPPSTLALEKPSRAQPAPAAPWSRAVGGGRCPLAQGWLPTPAAQSGSLF